jgi:cytochrome o ubiquinol oxidase operon protein cyoD
MKIPQAPATQAVTKHSNLGSYISGFILSIILTLAAYFMVVNKVVAGKALIASIIGLAVVQLFVQLLFFLHLGRETKPRFNLMIFLFATLVVTIVVGGSLWIMYNLDYNMMNHQIPKDMLDRGGI